MLFVTIVTRGDHGEGSFTILLTTRAESTDGSKGVLTKSLERSIRKKIAWRDAFQADKSLLKFEAQ